MKKLLIGFFALTSLSTFASTTLIADFSEEKVDCALIKEQMFERTREYSSWTAILSKDMDQYAKFITDVSNALEHDLEGRVVKVKVGEIEEHLKLKENARTISTAAATVLRVSQTMDRDASYFEKYFDQCFTIKN